MTEFLSFPPFVAVIVLVCWDGIDNGTRFLRRRRTIVPSIAVRSTLTSKLSVVVVVFFEVFVSLFVVEGRGLSVNNGLMHAWDGLMKSSSLLTNTLGISKLGGSNRQK